VDPDPDANTDADPDPSIFIIDLQDANKKLILKKIFCIYLSENILASFFNGKKSKKSKNNRNQSLSAYFLLNDSRIQS
jgi:hypothetical protein